MDYQKLLGKQKYRKNLPELLQSGGAPNSVDSGNTSSIKDMPKKEKKNLKDFHPCLNEYCDGFHLLKDCTKTSAEDKNKLLAKYKEGKAEQEVDSSTRVAAHVHTGQTKAQQPSSMFILRAEYSQKQVLFSWPNFVVMCLRVA